MGSTVPGVLDHLVGVVAALADDRTLVLDGQPAGLDGGVESDYIALGYTPDPDVAAVESEEFSYFGPGFEENYAVQCEVYSWTGDTVQKIPRDRAFTLLDLVTGAVLADPTLGGRVMSARLLSKGVIQNQTDRGSSVAIPFTIQVKALQTFP
jgi:hypothetical protein